MFSRRAHQALRRTTLAWVALAFAGQVGAATITGTVFEDPNYGGGAGRPLSTANTARVEGARVEIYNSSNVLQTALTTDANGFFTYTYSGNAERRIRVVNGTVRSERTGGTGCTTCVPVQTYRVEAPGGTTAAVTNEVGGRNPALVDATSATDDNADNHSHADSAVVECRRSEQQRRHGQRHRLRFQLRHDREHARCVELHTDWRDVSVPGKPASVHHQRQRSRRRRLAHAGRQRSARRRAHDAAVGLRIQHLHDPERRADERRRGDHAHGCVADRDRREHASGCDDADGEHRQYQQRHTRHRRLGRRRQRLACRSSSGRKCS